MSHQKFRVGLIQMYSGNDADENLKKALSNVKDCAKQGAQIIALPELFKAPYFCQVRDEKFFDFAEPLPGPTTEALGKMAAETQTIIITSVYEKTSEGKYYNTAVIIGTDGKIIGTYRKIHIPDDPKNHYDEAFYFDAGDKGVGVFETPYAKVSPMICYDQWFPEGARIAGQKGAQLLVYPTAIGWPTHQKDRTELNHSENNMWKTIQISHGIANNCFVAGVNRVGLQDTLQFWGTSFVSDPYGKIIAEAPTDKEVNLIAECNLEVIAQKESDWPFLNDCAKVIDKMK